MTIQHLKIPVLLVSNDCEYLKESLCYTYSAQVYLTFFPLVEATTLTLDYFVSSPCDRTFWKLPSRQHCPLHFLISSN